MVVTTLVFLKNLNIDFEEELVFLFEDDTEAHLSPYFSDHKVPVLIDGGVQIWDSLAIIEAINDRYPDRQGWPEDIGARAVARSVSAEMHSGYVALRDALPMNCRKYFANYPITREVQVDIDRITAVWEYCKQRYGDGGSWLFGEFSGADAMFAPIVLRLFGYDVKLSGFAKEYVEMVLNNEHLKSWVQAGVEEEQTILLDEV